MIRGPRGANHKTRTLQQTTLLLDITFQSYWLKTINLMDTLLKKNSNVVMSSLFASHSLKHL